MESPWVPCNSTSIQQVQGVDVTQAAHERVVGAIKIASQTSQGGVVNLRVGVGGINQVNRYQYGTEGRMNVQALERVEESPYVFSLPAQVTQHVVISRSACCLMVATSPTALQTVRGRGEPESEASFFAQAE